MARTLGIIAALAVLAGCGVQGDPVANVGDVAARDPVAPVDAPPVVLPGGAGSVTLGPGGLRLGAAGIPGTLGQ
ncbi:hypothetical protein [Loktanella sp. SALINAS62]|uniref:hypothetical protein n=1 Tax=Loktanella sp. SALINAS62 TaxID=2706124 RepID=UPI001B8C4564|nr:hypothetical protein [Loktanella sp. SALINAS62]MBS1301003.1 hypothetical protein [Loktanella sp. SALINAS62]